MNQYIIIWIMIVKMYMGNIDEYTININNGWCTVYDMVDIMDKGTTINKEDKSR